MKAGSLGSLLEDTDLTGIPGISEGRDGLRQRWAFTVWVFTVGFWFVKCWVECMIAHRLGNAKQLLRRERLNTLICV